MNPDAWRELCGVLGAFSGRVTASATHEIKNSLAVMNEQAGLVRELLHGAQKGREPDLARLEQILGRMLERIKLTDGVIRRLNQFAHTGDRVQGVVDPGEAVALAVESYRRLADAKEVSLECDPAVTGEVETNPLLLQAALFSCLDAATGAAPPRSTIRAGARRVESMVEFWFQGSGQKEPDATICGDAALCQALGAQSRWEQGSSRLVLTLPAHPR